MEDMVELWIYPGTYKRKRMRTDSRLERHKNIHEYPDARKWHDIRFESTLTTENGLGVCARHDLDKSSIHDSDHEDIVNVEANCTKCGWKILYNESFINTSGRFGQLFYHMWCHPDGQPNRMEWDT